ncbi:hypothetical protein PoB_002396200 [Plakobranchus ocellatus]|uniref:Uncharacterized protein n=1 Tax=Plakobranchus ocellatus TaxID=259542 RepID=A0AAV3ZQJ3_9GAST|nr:hypothetical protein PoB_002396200 [Plakobranchus ocellatus]
MSSAYESLDGVLTAPPILFEKIRNKVKLMVILGGCPILPFCSVVSSFISKNSTSNVRVLTTGLIPVFFLSIYQIPSYLVDLREVFRESIDFLPARIHCLPFTTKGSTRVVLPLPIIFYMNCQASLGSCVGFRFPHRRGYSSVCAT